MREKWPFLLDIGDSREKKETQGIIFFSVRQQELQRVNTGTLCSFSQKKNMSMSPTGPVGRILPTLSAVGDMSPTCRRHVADMRN